MEMHNVWEGNAHVRQVEHIQIVKINAQGQETVMEMQHVWKVNAYVLLVENTQIVKINALR